MRPIAPLERWLLLHRLGAGDGPLAKRAPLPAGVRSCPLTHTELWDKLVAESGLEWMPQREALAA